MIGATVSERQGPDRSGRGRVDGDEEARRATSDGSRDGPPETPTTTRWSVRPGSTIREQKSLRFVTIGSVDDGRTLINRLSTTPGASIRISSTPSPPRRTGATRTGSSTAEIDFSLFTDGLLANQANIDRRRLPATFRDGCGAKSSPTPPVMAVHATWRPVPRPRRRPHPRRRAARRHRADAAPRADRGAARHPARHRVREQDGPRELRPDAVRGDRRGARRQLAGKGSTCRARGDPGERARGRQTS